MTIRAGDLRARLTVTKTVLVDLPNGGQDETIVDVIVDQPAQVVRISADEQFRLGVPLATATDRATLRMPIDATGQIIVITPAMSATVRHGATGQVLDFGIVKAFDVDGRGRELELILERRIT